MNDENCGQCTRVVAKRLPALAVARCLPAVVARHSDRASIARGSPRTIGQKPEPTIRRGMTYKGSLREGAGAEGD